MKTLFACTIGLIISSSHKCGTKIVSKIFKLAQKIQEKQRTTQNAASEEASKLNNTKECKIITVFLFSISFVLFNKSSFIRIKSNYFYPFIIFPRSKSMIFKTIFSLLVAGSALMAAECAIPPGVDNVIWGTGNVIWGKGNQINGNGNSLNGQGNLARGDMNYAKGDNNKQIGDQNTAIGNYIHQNGYSNGAEGKFNTQFGNYNVALGNHNYMAGNANQLYGYNNYLYGNGNSAYGDNMKVNWWR